MTCFISASNDVFMRFLGDRLHGFEIIFFRFLFTLVTILPLIIHQGWHTLATRHPVFHVWRAVIGSVAIFCAFLAVKYLPLSQVTTFFFTQPLWFLPLAVIFLREKITPQIIIGTIAGFVGIILTQVNQDQINLYIIFPLMGAILFASLDLLAKKMVNVQENRLGMLFYFGLGTTLLAMGPAIMVWQTPTSHELLLLICLGVGGNLIQLCLFQAFSATQASSLAPFRYVELIFSSSFGFILFSEIPTFGTLAGAAVIIGTTLYVTYATSRRG